MLFALHRNYLRTCKECGYRWAVGRSVAAGAGQRRSIAGRRRAIRNSTGMGRLGATYSQGELATRSGHNVGFDDAFDALNRCPKCGVVDFDQRPLRKDEQA